MFGGTGVIAESVVHETRETTKYNHLVANTAILYHMQRMPCKPTALLQKGGPVYAHAPPPYRLGENPLDFQRPVPSLTKTVNST